MKEVLSRENVKQKSYERETEIVQSRGTSFTSSHHQNLMDVASFKNE